MSKPPTHQDLKNLPKALAPLTEEKRWLVWKWEAREGKGGRARWTKVPFQVRNPRAHAKSNDASTWGEYEQAVRRVHDGGADGIGYALLGSNIGAVDLDKCCQRDLKTRKVKSEQWARNLRDEANGAYREVTVSGTGQRIIGCASGPDLHRRFNLDNGGGVELFRNTGRYITVSGLQLGKCDELPVIDDFLNALCARYEDNGPPAKREERQTEKTDYAIIRNGAPPGDRSEPFQKAVWHLAATGHSVEQIEAELRRHPTGIAEKYLHPKDRLRREVARSYGKWQARADHAIGLDDFNSYAPSHSYIFRPTGEMWAGASINARIPPPQPKTPASLWLDRHRAVEQMTWAPGLPTDIKDQLISQGGWFERPGCTVFNLYRPPTLVPCVGPVDRWRDHLHRIYPNEADHIERWLAHRVQRPGEKINHALVLGGEQGIGKDTLLEPVKHAVGPWNFEEVSPQEVLSRWNNFLKSVVCRVSEARDLGESDRFKFYDHMKSYTAAPPDALRVDDKFQRQYYVPNVVGMIITTNYKTNGIYLPADDRRHYVAWSDATKEQFEETYWKEFWHWYQNEGGIEYVAHYLSNLDLSRFNAKAPPPKTDAFWAIVDAARAPEDAELADALDRLGGPDAVTLDEVREEAEGTFREWLCDRKNARQISHRMEAVGYERIRNPHVEEGTWKIGERRQMIYVRKDLSERDRLKAAKTLCHSGNGG